jgi:hypothetical protein
VDDRRREADGSVSTSKTFEIVVDEGSTASDILTRAREAARGAGITINGDDASGRFKGTAEGSYSVDEANRLVTVEVTNKPSFVPWGLVEGALRKVFR